MDNKAAGLLGIGLLGTALAERLIRSGYSVHGYDVSPEACRLFAEAGGQPAAGISDVAAAANCILLSLPDSNVVQDVLMEMLPHLQPGSVVIDTTTGTPDVSRNLAAQLAERNVEFVDSCVLGSSEVTRQGDATLLVGGNQAAVNMVRNVLDAISKQIYHVGEVGSGQEMKLVANLVLGLNRAVLAEGLHFADSFGLDPDAVLEVLKTGAAYSRVMDSKGRRMIEGDFSPQARLRQHLKDVNLILDHAKNADRQLPLSEVHQTLLKKVDESGGGDLDNSAIIRAWNNTSG